MLDKYGAVEKENILFFVGLFCLFVIYLPVLILNSDMYTMIHDQFDGEVLAYILNAKYFMQGHIPEFLSGTDKISLLPPSFGTTFFIAFLSLIMHFSLTIYL